MIFVTLGSQKFQFNRLLIAIDELLEQGVIKDIVFAQIGSSDYIPKHYQYVDFLSSDEFADMQNKMDLLITHGGTGAIIGAVKKGKKVIAVPRRAKYGEHVDDHQMQLVEQFSDSNLIYECDDCEQLGEALEQIKEMKFNCYQSNTHNIIDSIENFIEEQIL